MKERTTKECGFSICAELIQGALGYHLRTAHRQSATKTIEAHGLSYYNRPDWPATVNGINSGKQWRDWFPCTAVGFWSLLPTPATEHSEVTLRPSALVLGRVDKQTTVVYACQKRYAQNPSESQRQPNKKCFGRTVSTKNCTYYQYPLITPGKWTNLMHSYVI